MADTSAFTKMVPGFDFLQGLVKNAGAALPNMGQWIAPTLDPAELEKRIEELRTVQFWLEQNARMLGATIQALEVQRMTLSTLKTMNVQMGELRDSMKLRMPGQDDEAEEPEAPAAWREAPAAAAAPSQPAARKGSKAAKAQEAAALPAGVVDPMQWWGALTKQFTALAASAVKDTATDAARNLAGALVKQGIDAAGDTLKNAAAMPGAMAQKAAAAAGQSASPRRAAPARKAAAKAPRRKAA